MRNLIIYHNQNKNHKMNQAKIKKKKMIIRIIYKIKLQIKLLMSFLETNFTIQNNIKQQEDSQNIYKNLKSETFREGY